MHLNANTSPTMNLLWVDDDESDRFLYEQFLLEKNDWNVTWAHSIFDAVHSLSRRTFRILLADMMVPWAKGEIPSGSTPIAALISWLRDRDMTINHSSSSAADMLRHSRMEKFLPVLENRTIPVVMISAFYDSEMFEVTQKVSEDSMRIKWLRKPIDADELLRVIQSVRIR